MTRPLYLAGLAATLLAAPAMAEVAPPSISVSGEGSVSAAPDLAVIDGGVTTEARTAREASDTNNAAMGKVLLALKTAGIEDRDVQTSRLSLQPQYSQAPNRPGSNTVTGYRASNRVTLRLREVAKVASTIDTLVASGANDIGGINFEVAQASKLLDDARSEAVADARRKAEIYAKAAGVTLGAPLRISEEGGGAPAPMMFRAKMAAPTPVAQGEETLRVNVSVTWEIRPAQ
jgi:uncharacterized protein YggE